MSKQIIICADDFAQNEAISEGILSLVKLKRINAVSCLANTSHWPELSQELIALKDHCFIGLHINLTFGQPLSAKWRKHEGESFKGLSNLLRRAYLRQLDRDVIAAEIEAQLDVFTRDTHTYPDFIDGHQHIQQFPMIRQALFDVHRKYMGHLADADIDVDEDEALVECEHAPFFRNTYNNPCDFFSTTSFPKAQLLAILGGRRFKRSLIQEQIPTNASFAGIYNFKHAKAYRTYFKKFLKHTDNGGLIMCHPGNQSTDQQDPLHLYRYHELNYLMSDVFLTDIEDNGFKLCPVHQVRNMA